MSIVKDIRKIIIELENNNTNWENTELIEFYKIKINEAYDKREKRDKKNLIINI